MKNIKSILALLLLLTGITGLKAQQEEQNSMYFFNPLQFNPAYAGSRGNFHAVGIGRFQWVGVKGAPMTQFLSMHAPLLRQNLGLGMHISNDKIGARNRTSAFADAAASVKLNKRGHRLNFGLSAGVDYQTANFTNLYANDQTEDVYLNSYAKALFNVGAGLYYFGERFYAGFSVPRLLQPDQKDNGISLGLQKRHYFITGGYVFKLNSVLDFKPSTLVKITEGAPVTFDMNASFFMYKTLWLGAMYRYHESAGVNLGIVIKNNVMLGYAFDFPVNGLNRVNQFGTHEIMLSIDLKRKGKNFGSPRYF